MIGEISSQWSEASEADELPAIALLTKTCDRLTMFTRWSHPQPQLFALFIP
jgi:hypothetical protein